MQMEMDSVARMIRDMIQFIRKVSDSEQTKRAVLNNVELL